MHVTVCLSITFTELWRMKLVRWVYYYYYYYVNFCMIMFPLTSNGDLTSMHRGILNCRLHFCFTSQKAYYCCPHTIMAFLLSRSLPVSFCIDGLVPILLISLFRLFVPLRVVPVCWAALSGDRLYTMLLVATVVWLFMASALSCHRKTTFLFLG